MNKNFLVNISFFSLVVFPPAIAFAQDFSYFTTFIGGVRSIINQLIPIFIGIGILIFFWSLIKYINSANNEEQRKTAKVVMIWGIVYIFVILAIWGLVNLLSTITGIGIGGSSPSAPTVPEVCDTDPKTPFPPCNV